MIGKNNYYLKNTKEGTKVESYSIKKFKVGAASVVIGASIFFGAGAVAQASDSISNNKATDESLGADNKPEVTPKAQAKPVVENTRESVAAAVASKLENSEKETLNKTALTKLIEEMDGKFTNGKYASKTEDSVNQLKTALEEARTVLNNAKTQAELSQAQAKLATATTKLQTKPEEKKQAPAVDTTNGQPTVGKKATNTEKASDSNSIANSGSRDERHGKVLDRSNPFRADADTTDTDPSANQTYTAPAENADLNTLAEKLKTLPNVIENNKKVQNMDELGNEKNIANGSVTEIKEFGGWKAVGENGKFAIARKTQSGVFPAYTVNINRTNQVWVREQSFDRSSEYILLLSKLVTKQNRTETVYDDLPYKDNNESGAQTARAAKWFDGIEKTFKAYAKDEGTKVRVSFRTGYTGDNNGSKAKYKVEVFSIENGTEKSIYTAVVSPETTVNNSEMNVVAARDGNARNEIFTANGFTKEQIEEKLALSENRPNATGGTFTSREINLPKGVTSYKVRISLENKHQAGMSYNSSYLQYSLPITGLDFNVNQDTSIIAKNLLQRIYNKLLDTETTDKSGKTDATITAYTEELEKVKTLLKGELKTTEDYKKASLSLLKKQEALITAATNEEKNNLSAQVEALKKVSTSNKTPKSIEKYEEEFRKYEKQIEDLKNEVKTILDKQGNASKEEVSNVLTKVTAVKEKIDTAADLLVEKGNKTELGKAVREESTVKGNFKYYNADKTKRDAYDEAIKNGQKVIDDDNATQAQVD
ncbi:YSIRK-type signal peptide-containing protein, partial [Gemella sp.]